MGPVPQLRQIDWNKSSEEEPFTTITGTERLAVSLKWLGILDGRPLKIEDATSVILLFKIQHGLLDIVPGDVLQHSDRRTRGAHGLYKPAASQNVYVLILPQNYKPVEFPADSRH